MSYELDRKGWLLLAFLGAPKPLDRIRIQKTMFLFAMRSKASATEKYDFVPYNYGPFSFKIYPDLADLVREGLVEQRPSGSSLAYSITRKGEVTARAMEAVVPETRLTFLHATRDFVLSLDFNALLASVYKSYPQYAVKSVFRGA